MGLIGPLHFSRSRREEAAALRAALARAVVPRGTGQVGARVRLLGRPGESEGCARVSEGWLAKKVVAWAYEPITDSRISPPMHTRVLMISARVARESAKMHLRNMGCAWSSSIVSTCFLSLCACVSEPHGSQPKIEVPRRTLALPPVRRPDAPRDVGRSEARTLLSTAHTLANLSPDLGFEWHQEAPRSGVGVLGLKVCDARSEKRRVARVGDSAHLFGSIELTFVHDRPVLVVGDVRRQNGAPQCTFLTSIEW